MRHPLVLELSLSPFCESICCASVSPCKVKHSCLHRSRGVAGDSVAKGSQEKMQEREVELSFSSQLDTNHLGGVISLSGCSFPGGLCPLRDSLSSNVVTSSSFMEIAPRLLLSACNSSTRFSLFPVLHPSSLLESPRLELSAEEAGGLCPFGDSPCSGLNLVPTCLTHLVRAGAAFLGSRL